MSENIEQGIKVKKKSIYIGILGVVIVLVGICLWMKLRGEVLGNMNLAFSEPTTSTSTFSFKGEAGDRIKFSFAADKRNENLNLILYDSDGNAVYKLDSAKELVCYFTLENSDEYTLAAEYTDYTGKFRVKAYRIHHPD